MISQFGRKKVCVADKKCAPAAWAWTGSKTAAAAAVVVLTETCHYGLLLSAGIVPTVAVVQQQVTSGHCTGHYGQ